MTQFQSYSVDLATGKVQINVQEGELKLRVQGDEITFHVFQPMKHPDDDPNEDISESHYTEILQGDAKNLWDKPITAQKDTEKVMGMNGRIFHPPLALLMSTIGRCVSTPSFF